MVGMEKWADNNKEKVRISTIKDNKKRREIKRVDQEERRNNGWFQNWRENNKDKLKQYRENRKVKHHTISKDEWILCKEYFNNSCAYCGLSAENHYKKYAGEYKFMDLHKEHVDDNGTNDISNCIPSCHACNSRKWSFDFYEWYSEGNENYSKERIEKILKWIKGDYKIK